MKGITLCAECAYYNIKKHKCNRGAVEEPDREKGDDMRFFKDCPLPDVERARNLPSKHEAYDNSCDTLWKLDIEEREVTCPNCGASVSIIVAATGNYCPCCGHRNGRLD